MKTLWCIRYAHGDFGTPSHDEDKVRGAYLLIEPHLRERCGVVSMTEGTREEIVAEWLDAQSNRELGIEHQRAVRRMQAMLRMSHRTVSLQANATAPTLRPSAAVETPPRSELETLDEEARDGR